MDEYSDPYALATVRYAKHGAPWSIQDNQELMHAFKFGENLHITAKRLERKPSAAATQMARLLSKAMNSQDLSEMAYLQNLQVSNIDPEFYRQVRDQLEMHSASGILKLDRILGPQRPNQVTSPKLSEKYVNYNHLITLLQKGYTTCEVSFVEPVGDTLPTIYIYKISDKIKDLGCDRVVVEDPKGRMIVGWLVNTHGTPQIDVSAPYTYKWVVDVVRTQDYEEQVAREKQAVQMLQDGERAKAQADAMEALMATVPNREELLKLLGN